jgi:2-dehydro-3-deoxyphosphooctonate aldolase (KDO 8-P synthase)
MLAKINKIQHQRSGNFFLIAGPCVIEEESMAMEIAERILTITNKLEIPFIFKGSYRKANRSRLDSFTGIGDMEALEILKKVGERFNIPTITDIHTAKEAAIAAKYVDVLQIPAFLCRQTELLVAAAKTGKLINIKKGQFLSAESMIHAVNKVKDSGNNAVMLTDRGTMFGYQDMVVDFRGITTMQSFGVPVILDITHSLQTPNQNSGITGGKPDMIETIAKAGIATGVDGIFLETHPNPKNAKSDGANMLELDQLEQMLVKLINIQKATK